VSIFAFINDIFGQIFRTVFGVISILWNSACLAVKEIWMLTTNIGIWRGKIKKFGHQTLIF
jgi:hypothetical protein